MRFDKQIVLRLVIFGVLILFLIIIIYLIFSSSVNEPIVVNQKSTQEFSTEEIKGLQINTILPKELEICKTDNSMYKCLLEYDSENWGSLERNILWKDYLIKRLDRIAEYKDTLWREEWKVVIKFAEQIQDDYINADLRWFMFDDIKCETDFCKSVFIEAQKQLLPRLESRGMIRSIWFCDKLKEIEVQDTCTRMLK